MPSAAPTSSPIVVQSTPETDPPTATPTDSPTTSPPEPTPTETIAPSDQEDSSDENIVKINIPMPMTASPTKDLTDKFGDMAYHAIDVATILSNNGLLPADELNRDRYINNFARYLVKNVGVFENDSVDEDRPLYQSIKYDEDLMFNLGDLEYSSLAKVLTGADEIRPIMGYSEVFIRDTADTCKKIYEILLENVSDISTWSETTKQSFLSADMDKFLNYYINIPIQDESPIQLMNLILYDKPLMFKSEGSSEITRADILRILTGDYEIERNYNTPDKRHPNE